MSSLDSLEKVEVLPNPLVVACTTLPKTPLSYRWVINDAKTFLDRRSSFSSPSFSTDLPLKSLSEQIFWKITITKSMVADTFAIWSVRLECDKDTATKQQSWERQNATFLISGCKLTISNPQNEVVFTHTEPEFEIGRSFNCLGKEIHSFWDLRKYLSNDTLILQFDATIICHHAPSEVVHETVCKVPLDSIRKELNCLYRDEVLADVTIKCGDKEFKVHKAILASQSPVLRKMFEVDMKESRSNVIEISDLDAVVVSDLLDYIYTGSAPHLSTLVKELLNAANKYELPRLLAMCANELQTKLNVEDVVEVLLLANLHSAMELKAACLRFIHLHYREVKNTAGWKHLTKNADMYSLLLLEIMDSLAD